MQMKKIQGFCCLCLIFVVTGCDPTLPPNPVTQKAYYPYVTTDATYTSAIKVYNKSEYLMELDAIYRTPDGITNTTNSMTLNPHESTELIQANFTGSVQLSALTEKWALQTHLETKRNDNQGAALAQKADKLAGLGVSWFYHLGVTDFGIGDIRSSIITANPWYPGSIYLTIAPLGSACSDITNAELQQYNLHILNPLDIFGYLFPSGIDEQSFYIQGSSTPQSTGTSFTNYTGAHFIESSNGNIGLFDYKYQMNWVGYNDSAYVYLVDIQDNATRQDKILLKRNGPANVQPIFQQFTLHFYDYDGIEVAGSPCQVSLEEGFDASASYGVFSPSDLLGHTFSGSVWIDPPLDGAGYKARIKAGIIKQVSDQWRDITDNSPSRNQDSWGGAIAHVTTNDPDWHYRLILYHPGPGYIPDPGSDPDAEETGDIFCDPGTEPPDVTGGQVVLKLYDEIGDYQGALAIFMNPNETRYIDVDGIAETYLNGSFTGSIEFLPHISQQLEMWHGNGHAHGSTGNWAANQYN
jgi:hypothetical protein